MDRRFQLTFDALDPQALGTFWTHVLGYVEEPPPEGFDDWESALRAWGMPEERWNDGYAIVDPAGEGPRIFLQRVPEGKTAKNRMHLDVGLPGGGPRGADPDRAGVRARAAELAELGGRVVGEFDEPGSGFWVVMQDPEGNEFCLV
ncbi:VOC family protein [Cellulomonas sp. JZ18]|uniref:VOC family protein n=1 Tax=Cellulomonas sp. JZ18 TaxID=2654191 RepID=UPI0012D4889A|nr:VOC family protein [Cellulomonas sp. JZ18]QGQ19220.1 VOC family protein [Cellulomonas sp. JZ18]